MIDYPVNLRLEGRKCLVVGGGTVGLRKVRSLMAAGSGVRLVDPAPPENLPPQVEVVARPYRREDLEDICLVFAAAGNRSVNARVAAEAKDEGLFVNVADAPGEGNFTVPAALRREKLLMAFSTSGGSPAFAALARDAASAHFGEEWGVFLEIAVALRQKRLTSSKKSEYNRAVLNCLLDSDICGLIAARDRNAIDRLLRTHFGAAASLAELEVQLPSGTP
ncbi:MAG TPA: bifunctional precorrin-2 dehydrogenase/sirohydrochlorin ferrochelatase [Desulfuromonadales bacterium]|nr:bifunctional precorrin-2 dehydrogenase/sirohydrochlorin ferrochelatase [Desulfuromonadales bacterium]